MYMYCSVSRVQCVTEAVETTSLIQRESARSTSPGGGAAGADDDDDGGAGGEERVKPSRCPSCGCTVRMET